MNHNDCCCVDDDDDEKWDVGWCIWGMDMGNGDDGPGQVISKVPPPIGWYLVNNSNINKFV